MRIHFFTLILMMVFVSGVVSDAAADQSPLSSTNDGAAASAPNSTSAVTSKPGAVIVTNTINNVLVRRPSHGTSGGAVKPNVPATASTPVTINNIAPGPANAPLRAAPGGDNFLTVDAKDVALAAIAAVLLGVALFLLGQWFAHRGEAAHPGTPGEWLDLGCPGAFGFATLDIEARVRGGNATWSWHRISRQKLIDHLNSTPKFRDTLLQTASAHSSAAGHGGQISTVVNQAAH